MPVAPSNEKVYAGRNKPHGAGQIARTIGVKNTPGGEGRTPQKLIAPAEANQQGR